MPERRPERGTEQGAERGTAYVPEPAAGRARIPGTALGRRTTWAVACVLAVLGAPTASAAAYTAAPPTAVAGVTTATSPVPAPSPGVPPRPEPQPAPQPGPDAGNGPEGGEGNGRAGPGGGRPRPAQPQRAGDDEGAVEDAASGATADGDDTGPRAPGDEGDDGKQTLEDVRKRIKDLHDRAESATEAYNAAEAEVTAQREKIAGLERRAAHTRERLAELTERAGALARAQYRAGGLPAAARLMLSDDPQEFLRDAGLVRQGQQAANGLVTSLTETRERLDRYTRDARKRYRTLQQNRRRKAAAQQRVEKQLKKAEKLESRLAADERARLRELERRAAYARQLRWLRTGVLAEIDSQASARGRRAVEYATAQVGKDYEWGAEGPATYDCSGLTMRAWEAAGVDIPRTSQEQWRQLPHVDVEDMRPGDLIIYTEDAGHVGMYLGDGVMVHAPRTGRQITIEGAGSYPILGVVRPDK